MNNGIFQKTLTFTAIVLLMWLGKAFLIPLAYALLIAVVLYPMVRFLIRKKFPESAAIALPTLLMCLVFLGIIALLSYELTIISSNWALIQNRIEPLLTQIHQQLEDLFGWTTAEQNLWLKDSIRKISQNAGTILKQSTSAMLDGLFNLIIIPIYIVLILFNRKKLVKFAMEIAPEDFKPGLDKVIQEAVIVFGGFIRGMVFVYMLVGLLNTLGLWLIGVENPIIYGMLTAVMTIIPYFGILISAMLPITLSWLNTGTYLQPLGIISVFSLVQYLEANLIFPYIVGRNVNLNTLASIIAITLGAIIWGVSGMILFLPMFAVIRIFAQHYPQLKAWNTLLSK